MPRDVRTPVRHNTYRRRRHRSRRTVVRYGPKRIYVPRRQAPRVRRYVRRYGRRRTSNRQLQVRTGLGRQRRLAAIARIRRQARQRRQGVGGALVAATAGQRVMGHQIIPPRLVTGPSYLDPRRAYRQFRAENRAFSHSRVLFDPTSRVLYSGPSDRQVTGEYRALQRHDVDRAFRAARRLERWGYEGPTRGQLALNRIGRAAVPEWELKRTGAGRATSQFGRTTGAIYEHGGARYRKVGDRYVPLPSRGSWAKLTKGAVQGLEHAGTAVTKWIGQVPTARQSSVSRGPGGTMLIATAAPQTKGVKAAKTIGGRAVQDLLSLPPAVVPGVYRTVQQVAQGHGKQVLEDFKNQDPVALALQGRFDEAQKQAFKHPGLTGLELVGGIGSADRLLGAGVRRSGAAGERYAGLVGRRATVPGTRFETVRHYPKGLTANRMARNREREAAQAADQEVARGRQAEQTRDYDKANEHFVKAAALDPHRVPEKAIRDYVNVREAWTQSRRKPNRKETERAARATLVPTRKGGRIQSLIVQGIVRGDKDSLEAYLKQIDERHDKGLAPRQQRANRRLRVQIQKALDDEIDLPALRQAAKDYAAVTRPLEDEAVGAGLIDAGEAKMARYKYYAAQNMGARQVDEIGMVPAHHVQAAEDLAHEIRVSRSHQMYEGERQLLKDEGRKLRLTPEEVERHMRGEEAGPERASGTVVDEGGRPVDQPPQKDVKIAVQYTDTGEVIRGRVKDIKRRWAPGQSRDEPRRGEYEVTVEEDNGTSTIYRQSDIERGHVRVAVEGGKPGGLSGRRGLPGDAPRRSGRPAINPEDISFVSQQPGALGSGAYNIGSRQARGLSRRRRGHRGVTEGLIDTDPERLVEQAVKLRGLVDSNREYREFIKEVGYREGGDPNAELFHRATKGEAQRLAEDLNSRPGGHQWRVVRLNPWGGRSSQLRRLLEDADAGGFVKEGETLSHPASEAVEHAVSKNASGDGPWGVIPEEAAHQMEQHAQVYRAVSPAWRALSQTFKATVLPFSLPWLTGNATEGLLRSALLGATPGSRAWRFERQVHNTLAQHDTFGAYTGELGEEVRHAIPGGHYGGAEYGQTYQSAIQFARSPKMIRGLANGLARLRRTRGPGDVAAAVSRYTTWVFHGVNAGVEAQFSRGVAGRYMLDYLTNPAERRVNETAVEQAARGILNTPEQVQMSRFVQRAIGQYDAFGPEMRKWILGYTPFLAWSMNAFKFVASVLPRDHPGLTAVIAANDRITEDWRKAHGLEPFVSGAVPDFLQGAIPLPGGSKMRLSRYTPFGFWSNPVETVASNFIPQIAGPLMAFHGLDWKGKQLRGPNGESLDWPQLLEIGTREFAYSNIPIIGIAARAVKKGGRPWEAVWQVEDPRGIVEPRDGGGSGAQERIYKKIRESSGQGDTDQQKLFEKLRKVR